MPLPQNSSTLLEVQCSKWREYDDKGEGHLPVFFLIFLTTIHSYANKMNADSLITLFLNGSENVYLDGVAMLATKAWIWIGLYLTILFVVFREHDMRQFLGILLGLLLCVLVADQISSGIVKPLVARYRPTHSPEIAHLTDVVCGYRGGMYGFFSSHASNTMAIAVFLSLIFRKKIITLTLIAWSLLNCWTRLYLGVHYCSDILVGLLFGCLTGSIVYLLYRFSFGKHPNRNYVVQRLTLITTSFALTLLIIAVPWKLFL